jgi:hypothetical protein
MAIVIWSLFWSFFVMFAFLFCLVVSKLIPGIMLDSVIEHHRFKDGT